MTRIVDTQATVDEHVQADGSRMATERHIDDLGRPMTFGPYRLGPGESADTIAALRAERLNVEFAARDAEIAQASLGHIPWSHLEFEDQLGVAAADQMLEFFNFFEGNGNLTPELKRVIRRGWHRYNRAHYIERPLRAEVLQLLALLRTLGILDQARIDAVVAAAGG